MNQTTDNQHFVPEFYLRGFTIIGEKSLIWEYDKNTHFFANRPKSVRNICSKYRYYRQIRDDGVEEPDLLEQGFSRKLENSFASLYRMIFRRLSEQEPTIWFTPAEYGQFCYSVAIQYTRVPSFRDKMAIFMQDWLGETFARLVERDRQSGALPPEVDEMLQQEYPRFEIEDFGTIKTMLEAATSVSNALMDKTPGFFRAAPGCYFVTSDNPVSFFVRSFKDLAPQQIEPVHPDAEVFFPLSRRFAVVFFPHKSGYAKERHAISCNCLDLLAPGVRFMNSHTATMGSQYLYASVRDEDLRSLYQ